ncbi:unnamed protein product [Anisakis simplex]|uniref:Uncharacterized protein n=1 Tax=Anisakis simplex TaxID=6269 RepID=A0A0M3K373_ANISI|nr:unnamed protein product [Anisakis simplex]
MSEKECLKAQQSPAYTIINQSTTLVMWHLILLVIAVAVCEARVPALPPSPTASPTTVAAMTSDDPHVITGAFRSLLKGAEVALITGELITVAR